MAKRKDTVSKKRYEVGDRVWYKMRGKIMRNGKIKRVLTDFGTTRIGMYVMANGDLVKPSEIKAMYP